MGLIEKLTERQERMTDRQFAAQLGIGRSTWNGLRRGRKHAGRQVLHHIVARYPSLRDEALDYLASLPRRKQPSRGAS